MIPAHNEQHYLNRTVENFISAAGEPVEVIVVLDGYEQDVDKRTIVLQNAESRGMRHAVNQSARLASGELIMVTDAHCTISAGWDTKMAEVLERYPRGIAVAPMTALNKDWSGGRGWYGFCDMLPNMQPKWRGRKTYKTIEPNMAVTGCGLMMRRDWFLSWGGLDETLAPMGAIGSEFSIHGWLDGDGIYTRTDVLLGHIFSTGGYDTAKANRAQEILHERWGHRYPEILAHFPEKEIHMSAAEATKKEHRTVVVERRDEHVTSDTKTGKPIKKVVEVFKYVFEDDGKGLSEAEIGKRYGPQAKKVEEQTFYPTEDGQWSRVA